MFDRLADTGRFLTFSGRGATIGYRFREDPNDRVSLGLISEADTGIFVRAVFVALQERRESLRRIQALECAAEVLGMAQITKPDATPGGELRKNGRPFDEKANGMR